MVNSASFSPVAGPPESPAGRASDARDVAVVLSTAGERPLIVWANEAFGRTTGYPPPDVVGREPTLLHGPGTDGDQVRRLAQARAEGRPGSATLLCYRRDGSAFWNDVHLSPVRDDAGAITHWVSEERDVTPGDAARDDATGTDPGERRHGAGLGLVAEVSELLVDPEAPGVLRDVAALLVRDVVAWAGFFLDDGGLRPADDAGLTDAPARRRRHGPRPARTVHQQALRLAEAGAALDAGPDPVQRLLDGDDAGGTVVLDPGPDLPPESAAGWLSGYLREHLPGHLDARSPGELPGSPAEPVPDGRLPAAVLVLPLHGRRGTLGLLAVVPRTAAPGTAGLAAAALDDGARTVLELVTRRVGTAVENLRLHTREHRIAEALQRAMLPEQADVDGLDVWSYYAPGSAHAQVGGDWYDVLPVGPGVGVVVVGDVVGHDVEAAASMGQLRSVVRAYAVDQPAPAAVLQRVDALVAGLRMTRAASVLLATLTRSGDGWDVEYSRAGHLPPMLVRGSQVRRLSGASGPLVGFGRGRRTSARERLRPGDVLVAYTDGLIERRDRSLRDGVEALAAACAEVRAADAAGIGEALLARLGDAPEDDVAVVVVRVPDPEGDRAPRPDERLRQRRWLLPNEAASIARARHAVVRSCHAWGLPDAPAAELVVSELVANAVLHGWGHVALRLADTGRGLRIEVEDANPAPPVPTDGHAGRVGGYGMQIVDRLAEWGWEGTGTGKLVWARVLPGGSAGGR